MEIKHLELSERDFQLLIDALDCLPEKNQAGEIMTELLVGVMKKDHESPGFDEFDRKRAADKLKREREKEALKEDIKILQGKLLMFKRLLIQQDALKQVDDILNK